MFFCLLVCSFLLCAYPAWVINILASLAGGLIACLNVYVVQLFLCNQLVFVAVPPAGAPCGADQLDVLLATV